MPAVVSAFFPKFVIGIKAVFGSNQVCVVLEEVIVCMCWSPQSQCIPKVAMNAFFEPTVIYFKYRKSFMLVGRYPMLIKNDSHYCCK